MVCGSLRRCVAGNRTSFNSFRWACPTRGPMIVWHTRTRHTWQSANRDQERPHIFGMELWCRALMIAHIEVLQKQSQQMTAVVCCSLRGLNAVDIC
eukprot:476856-Pelagomonas_calceolata.AAC.3